MERKASQKKLEAKKPGNKKQEIKKETEDTDPQPSATSKAENNDTRVFDDFTEARNLILSDEGVREAAVFKYGARCMSTADENSKQYRFESFVGIFLSPMVTDPINWRVVQRLKTNLEGGLTAEAIKNTSEVEIYRNMSDMNFNKTKSKNLKTIATQFADEYDGDIPKDYDELLKLPGVGMKVAKLVMEVCWHQGFGIPIDTHGHRVANRVGWVSTDKPDKTALALEKLIPPESYHLVNEPLVALGQSYCTAQRPNCVACPIAHLCQFVSHPSYNPKVSTTTSKPRGKGTELAEEPPAKSAGTKRNSKESKDEEEPKPKSRKHIVVVPQI